MSELTLQVPVIPVITLNDASKAVKLATSLKEGGLDSIEITLRTNEALKAVEAIKEAQVPIKVGVGSISTARQLIKAEHLGADFAVSPGLTPKLAESGKTCAVPFIPGINTASEIMRAREWHFKQLKFFPAEATGGAKTIKDFKSVFQDVTFCPTGGVHLENIDDYLELDNVFAVGGSWLAPQDLIEKDKWDDIVNIADLTVKKIQKLQSSD